MIVPENLGLYQIMGGESENYRIFHGSLVLDKNSSIYSVIGIPPLPGTIIAFKKYQLCNNDESIWARYNRRYCRLVHDYTQYSILTHTSTMLDPRFYTEVPVISTIDARRMLDPFRKLKKIMVHPEDSLHFKIIDFLNKTKRETGIELEFWGVTGSILADIHNPDISDIDLILFGEENSEIIFEYLKRRRFRRIINWENLQSRYEIDPKLLKLLSEGRSRFMWKDSKFSITFIEGNIYRPKYCRTLQGFLSWDNLILKELRRFRSTIKIDSTNGALTYPPCIDANDYLLLSFDHILAPILYGSKCLRVDALVGRTIDDIEIVFLGVKENRLTRIKTC
ncbi:MAG: hypothetical protein F7B59_01040 [Desulfurococcales archaeon]|nr:hypothetical protein [Desulfurococcales archaeon]